MRLVPVVPPPRRTALVPVLPPEGVDEVDEPDPRVVAEPPPEDDDEEPEPPEPDELDPLEGGADRTGCCSGDGGGEYEGGAAGGGASLGGGAVRGMAWAEANAGEVNNTTAPPASKLSNKRLCVRIAFPQGPTVQLYCHP